MRAEDIALAAKHEIQNLRAAVAMELLERKNQEDLNDILADEVTRMRAALKEITEDNWFFIEDAKGIAFAALGGDK
jgi:hypothetical protein